MTIARSCIRGLLAAAGGVTYMLRAVFANATPKTFTNGEPIDTEAEGVFDGSLTVVDTSTGVVEIASGNLRITGDGAANTTGVYGEEIARQAGLVFAVDLTVHTSGVNYIGLHTSAALSTSIEGFRVSGTTIEAAVNGAFLAIGSVTVGQTYNLKIAADSTGVFLFIKGGTEYLTGTLLFIGGSSAASFFANIQETGTVSSNYPTATIPDVLYTEQITPIQSGFSGFTDVLNNPTITDDYVQSNTTGTHQFAVKDLGVSTCYIKATCVNNATYFSRGWLLARYQDVNNHWIARLYSAAANPDQWAIMEVNGGVATVRGSLISTDMLGTGDDIHFSVDSDDNYFMVVNGLTTSYQDLTGFLNGETTHGVDVYTNNLTVPGKVSNYVLHQKAGYTFEGID